MEINNLIREAHNGFELQRVFGIQPELANINDIIRLADIYPYSGNHAYINRVINYIRRMIFGVKKTWICYPDPTVYHEEVFTLNNKNSYLFHGNWNNEKYSKDVNNEIAATFVFPKNDNPKNIEIIQKMLSENSVSIHVRHGDYTKYGFPLLSLDYYYHAVSVIEETIASPHYYIFSDDIDFVRGNFKFLKHDFTIVDWNKGRQSFRDMQLMSMCKHNINANSTFSYWGA